MDGNAERDGRRSLVRRITAWTAAGSLAATVGVAGLLGAAQQDTAANSTTTSTDTGDTGSGDAGNGGSGETWQKPRQAPGSSDDGGSVTSGGS